MTSEEAKLQRNAYRKARRDGPLREVIKDQKRQSYLRNREKVLAQCKIYRDTHLEEIIAAQKKYRDSQDPEVKRAAKTAEYVRNRAKYLAYNAAKRSRLKALNPVVKLPTLMEELGLAGPYLSLSKEDSAKYQKAHRLKNAGHQMHRRKIWRTKIFRTCPEFKLRVSMQSRLCHILREKGITRSSTINLSGAELRAHLEVQFLPGMTWENHGIVWHVDHLVPCSSFDFSDPEQARACFSLSNLRPLWAKDNLRKHATPLTDSELAKARSAMKESIQAVL